MIVSRARIAIVTPVPSLESERGKYLLCDWAHDRDPVGFYGLMRFSGLKILGSLEFFFSCLGEVEGDENFSGRVFDS